MPRLEVDQIASKSGARLNTSEPRLGRSSLTRGMQLIRVSGDLPIGALGVKSLQD